MGVCKGQTSFVSAGSASGKQHGPRDGDSAGADDGVGSLGIARRTDEAGPCGKPVILWKGHCSVHQRFLPGHVDAVRAKYPGIQVIVHPECRWEVCQKADALGSTERLIALVEEAPEGTMFAIGTEIHLVNRLAKHFAAAGQEDHHAGRHGLPVHDDVSHQPAASGVGAGEPGRGAGRESHPGASKREAMGACCVGPDARDWVSRFYAPLRQRSVRGHRIFSSSIAATGCGLPCL